MQLPVYTAQQNLRQASVSASKYLPHIKKYR